MIRFRTFLAIVTIFGLIVFLISRGPQQDFERTVLPSVSPSDVEVPKSSRGVATTDTDETTPEARPEMAAVNREINLGNPISVEGDKPTNSSAVSRVQSGLSRLGYDPGPVDGVMGSKTETAIRNYERDHNLLVDGRPTFKLARHIAEQLQKDIAERIVQNYCKRYGKRAVLIDAGPIGPSTVKRLRAYDCVNPADLHD